ncbi:TPA: glycosyltransferase [Clostridioides difficile]
MIRSLDLLTDSRVHRYEKWLNENHIEYKALGWNRENKNIERKNTKYFNLKAEYNLGINGIKYRIKWNLFLLKYLISNLNSYDIVHACDFDTIMPSLLMRLLGKFVIFDIFDWFSDEVKTNSEFINKIINVLEKTSVKLSDTVIICEKERLKQMDVVPRKYIVLPNIPKINSVSKNKYVKNGFINISYVGGFYPSRGLEELLEAISELKNCILHIAGFGNLYIEEKVKIFDKKFENIIYYGKVSYDKAIQIMNSSDVIYAMYYKDNKNNLYAAPNKFYEGIFLKKPIITTKGTLVGDKVKSHKSGYVLEEGKAELINFLKDLRLEDLEKFNCDLDKNLKLYENELENCMNEYSECIKNI